VTMLRSVRVYYLLKCRESKIPERIKNQWVFNSSKDSHKAIMLGLDFAGQHCHLS